MKKQINTAYARLHNATVDYGSVNMFERIRQVIAIKTKAADIEKNKLFMDNLDFINRAIEDDDWDWLSDLLPRTHDILLYEVFMNPLTLSSADYFTLEDVQSILENAPGYSKNYCDSSQKA